MAYKYTLLKMDGTTEDMGIYPKEMHIEDLYGVLGCRMVECIPTDYYDNKEKAKGLILWGDDEGRFEEENTRNPHFKVLKDYEGNDWDVVGNILKQEKVK